MIFLQKQGLSIFLFGFVDLPKELPPPYSEKDELKIKAEREKKKEDEERKREEDKKKEEQRKREEEKRKEEELPPWVRYHNLHSGDPHKHCQCIHNQKWYPVSAEIVANQPKVGSGPQIKEIL